MKPDKLCLLLMCIVVFTAFIWISSCRHDAVFPPNLREICFEGEVLPIFLNSCNMAGCHDGSGEAAPYNNFLNISQGVISRNPNTSPIYQSVIKKSGENKMPPNGPLSIDNRTILRIWIEQGANLTLCDDNIQPAIPYNSRSCFSRDILPLLRSSCAMPGCHDAISHQSDFIYVSYLTTMGSVVPGNREASLLYHSITSTLAPHRMPPLPRDRLTQPQIDSIGAWILRGAVNDKCGEACDTINPVTFSGVIWPTIQTTCTGCHSGVYPALGISLTKYADVRTVAASGLLMNALTGNGVIRMPQTGSLSSCKIKQFRIWTSNGYLNN